MNNEHGPLLRDWWLWNLREPRITFVWSSNDNPAPAAAPRCRGSCPRSRCPAPGRGWRPGPRSPSSAGARRQTPAGSAQTSTMSRCRAGAHTGSFSSAHFPKVAAISDAACSAYYGPLGEGVGCVQGPSTCQVRATCQASRVTCPPRVTRAAPCWPPPAAVRVTRSGASPGSCPSAPASAARWDTWSTIVLQTIIRRSCTIISWLKARAFIFLDTMLNGH